MTKAEMDAIRARCEAAAAAYDDVSASAEDRNLYFRDEFNAMGDCTQDVPTLLDALEEAEARFVTIGETGMAAVAKMQGEINRLKADRDFWQSAAQAAQSVGDLRDGDADRWKARAEALERALVGDCGSCIHPCSDFDYLLNGDRAECGRWVFDEPRFAPATHEETE